MIKEYCDICGKGLTDTAEDLFLSRKFIVQHANAPERTSEFSLCRSCKETMYYFMKNPVLLKKNVAEMSLANRLRFLFKR